MLEKSLAFARLAVAPDEVEHAMREVAGSTVAIEKLRDVAKLEAQELVAAITSTLAAPAPPDGSLSKAQRALLALGGSHRAFVELLRSAARGTPPDAQRTGARLSLLSEVPKGPAGAILYAEYLAYRRVLEDLVKDQGEELDLAALATVMDALGPVSPAELRRRLASEGLLGPGTVARTRQ